MGGVGPVPVVVDAPVLDDHASFEERVELPAVEQLVAEAPVKARDPRVLPWQPGSISTLSVELLRDRGLVARVELPDAHGDLFAGQTVVVVQHQDRLLWVHPEALSPLLFELMHPMTSAAGID